MAEGQGMPSSKEAPPEHRECLTTLLNHADELAPTVDDVPSKDARRLSLSKLMHRGLVTGLKGYWENSSSSRNNQPGKPCS
jgi:hypothetical protein